MKTLLMLAASVLIATGLLTSTVMASNESKATETATEQTSASREGMIKISYILRKREDLTREAFLKYWMEQHPKAVDHQAFGDLGVKRYIQLHAIDDEEARNILVGERTGLVDEFDGIAEIWLASDEALKRDWTTPKAKEYLKAFFEDEKNFVDWSRSTIMVSKEIIMMP